MQRQTKIVCTIGPATSSETDLRALIEAARPPLRAGARSRLRRAVIRSLRRGHARRPGAHRGAWRPRAGDREDRDAGALDHFDAIADVADGIMIARGDLSLETPFARVPVVQKQLIAKANRRAKPVITATQMLYSMVSSPQPTRAEVADVANAILDGSDAVMLSEETAVGEHPVRAVEVMVAIARETESDVRPDALPLRAMELSAQRGGGGCAGRLSSRRPAAQ